MRSFKFSFSVMCLCLLISNAIAQNTFREYPADLSEQKIVFLAYDSLEIKPDLKKSEIKAIEFRNAKAKIANEQLEEACKAYPFAFKIAKRSDLENLYSQGYRYALENDMMELNNTDEGLNASTNANNVSEMYILDLKTKDKYYLFQITQSYVYFYKGIMKKFLKQIN